MNITDLSPAPFASSVFNARVKAEIDAKGVFIARFRAQLEANGVRVTDRLASTYWYDRACEPDFTPEQWADAHRIYGDEE